MFERLWEEVALPAVLRDLLRRRRPAFDFEWVVFALVMRVCSRTRQCQEIILD